MTLICYGNTDGGVGGSRISIPHSESIGAGAKWHWPLDSAQESVVGGSPVDLTGTLALNPGGPGAEVGFFDSKRSTSVTTGTIGSAVQIQGAISIAMWIYRTGANTTNLSLCGARIAGAGLANNIQWSLDYEASSEKVRWIHQHGSADATDIVVSPSVVALNTWEHWCAVRNVAGTEVKLYKNGLLNATSGALTRADGGTNITDVSIMNNHSTAEFQGMGRSAIVYDEELNAANVLALYESTSSTGTWA